MMNFQNVTVADLEKLSLSEMAERYNTLAPVLSRDVITKFRDKSTGVRRLQQLYIELEKVQPKVTSEPKTRKKRQKVFMYPPADEGLKIIAPNSLRARARDLLINGATFAQVEDLIREFDAERGKPVKRVSERAYGLVRLLHTYIGYGLREEGQGDSKLIYLVTLEQRKGNKVETTKPEVTEKVLSEDAKAAIADGWV